MACWIRKEILDRVPELPRRVDFDDWEKERGLVNLLSEKSSKPWLPAGFYKRTKGGRVVGEMLPPRLRHYLPVLLSVVAFA